MIFLKELRGLMFYNQYTFNSCDKSEPLNLSYFMMKLIEELRILLFGLALNLGFHKEANLLLIHCLKNLVYLYQLTANHLRGFHICL